MSGQLKLKPILHSGSLTCWSYLMLFGKHEIRFEPIHIPYLISLWWSKFNSESNSTSNLYFRPKKPLPHKCFNLSKLMLIIPLLLIALSMEAIVLQIICEHGLTYFISHHMFFIFADFGCRRCSSAAEIKLDAVHV